jgi:hypothetical protein
MAPAMGLLGRTTLSWASSHARNLASTGSERARRSCVRRLGGSSDVASSMANSSRMRPIATRESSRSDGMASKKWRRQ